MKRLNIKESGGKRLLATLDDNSHKLERNTRQVREMQEHDDRLDLLFKVGKKVEAETEVPKLLDEIMEMTQKTLKVAASSVLLIDEKTNELFFQTAKGKAGPTITKMGLKVQYGIAPWVAQHRQPLIVNNVAEDTRFNKSIDEHTSFVTRSILCVPLVVGDKTIGVLEVLNKLDGDGFNNQDLELLTPLASFAALAIDNARLHQSILESCMNTIRTLAATIDAKDPHTYGHSQRVMEYALLGADSLSLPPAELKIIEYGGILHDIGKIAVDEAILRKPASLTPEEWTVMRTHSYVGASIIAHAPFLEKTSKLVLTHHEKYNGSGYPDKLSGEEIPIGSRLLSVADAFDTMTTSRSYRAALSVEFAIDELRKCTGTQFCPVAVEAFITAFKKQRRVPQLT